MKTNSVNSLRFGYLLTAFLVLAGAACSSGDSTGVMPDAEVINVEMTTPLAAPPAEVWKTVGDFGGLASFLEGVESVEVSGSGAGATRTITLKEGDGGAVITETLDELDEAGMSYTYSIVESPLPVADYTATLKVTASQGGGSLVTWSSSFKARGTSDIEAKAYIEGFYLAGFDGLRKLHNAE